MSTRRIYIGRGFRQSRFPVKDLLNAVSTCHRFIYCDNKICQFHQFHQNLGHVIYKRHYLTLCQHPVVHMNGPDPDQGDNGSINYDICHRIHQCRDPAHHHLHMVQGIVFSSKPFILFPLFIKGPEYSRPRQVLTGPAKDPVQCRLHLFV